MKITRTTVDEIENVRKQASGRTHRNRTHQKHERGSLMTPKPGTPLPWPQNGPFPTNQTAKTQKDIDRLEKRRQKDWAYAYHAANALPALESENLRLREALEIVFSELNMNGKDCAATAWKVALEALNRKDA